MNVFFRHFMFLLLFAARHDARARERMQQRRKQREQDNAHCTLQKCTRKLHNKDDTYAEQAFEKQFLVILFMNENTVGA